IGVGCAALAVICVVIGSAGAAVVAFGPGGALVAPPTPTPRRPIGPPTPTPVTERLEIVGDRPLITRGGGIVQVSGLIRNPESQPRSAIVVATFFGAENRPLGQAVGAAQDIPPNDTKPFTLDGPDRIGGFVRVEITVQSRLPTGSAPSPVTFGPASVTPIGAGYQVEAQATNTDRSRPARFTAVASLVDRDGNLVGIARSGPQTLAPGAAATVTITSADRLPPFATARVQIDRVDP
ncbi:MAG: FxLYD domain-containing protein, partial [Dehalococcoidia bacterium]|nr:FxLYD domain-containing protein [Dehalococcoidia bacterium]